MKPYNPKNLPPQENFFYFGGWTAAMDQLFLSSLIAEKRNGAWNPANVPPMSSVLVAIYAVNASFNVNFSMMDASKRLTHLQDRFHLFRKMQNQPGAFWDRRENKLSMNDKSWKKISEKWKMAKAYWYKGEPEFYNLLQLFGPTVMKDEDQPPVINISDNTVRVNSPEYVTIMDSDSEEVTSPIMKDHSTIKRRLWSSEAESTTMHAYPSQFPPRIAFPPPPQGGNLSEADFPATETDTQTGSSCASNSTWRWWSP